MAHWDDTWESYTYIYARGYMLLQLFKSTPKAETCDHKIKEITHEKYL